MNLKDKNCQVSVSQKENVAKVYGIDIRKVGLIEFCEGLNLITDIHKEGVIHKKNQVIKKNINLSYIFIRK